MFVLKILLLLCFVLVYFVVFLKIVNFIIFNEVMNLLKARTTLALDFKNFLDKFALQVNKKNDHVKYDDDYSCKVCPKNSKF